MLLVRLGMLAGALTLMAWTTADPDLWGHVRFGLDTIRDGALPAADPYSFTSDRPWVNHEWLAEVIMAAAYRADGARGLVALKLLVIALTAGLVVAALRQRRWDPIGHDLLVGAALLGIFGRVHPVRPQLFSVLLCAALLLLLSLADRGRRRLLVLVPPLLALWANLHGGYLVGLGIAGIWSAVRLYRPAGTGLRPRSLVLLGIATVASTLATPYGVRLWLFLVETVGPTRTEIGDWQMLLETGSFLIGQFAIVTVVAALAIRTRRADPAYVLIAFSLFLATLLISRFDAFYALAVVMLLGPYLGQVMLKPAPPIGIMRMAAVAVAGAVAIGAIAHRSSCIEIRTAPEPDATAFAAQLSGRMLTFFDWGQYAIWHLAPAIQVSMDGRRETVYSEDMTAAHGRIYINAPDAVQQVEALRPDWIWLPESWPVVSRLESAGWGIAFRGPSSVILGHGPPSATTAQQLSGASPRCFPER